MHVANRDKPCYARETETPDFYGMTKYEYFMCHITAAYIGGILASTPAGQQPPDIDLTIPQTICDDTFTLIGDPPIIF